MIPVIAIIGRPNVGKSTLFNCLTRSRDAVVADTPGVTRDRQYGHGKLGDKPYVIIDTGGIDTDKSGIEGMTVEQAQLAILEADVLLFVVDARNGLMPADKVIAQQLRKLNKKLIVVVNKIDGLNESIALSEFHELGMSNPIGISAAHHRGIDSLVEKFQRFIPNVESQSPEIKGIKIAIAGKPNVGKSTLVNRMLGEERVIVYDQPGTTRDSIYIPLERMGKQYTLIDTAGLRRRSHVTDHLEKISVVKTLQSIEEANVIIFLIDAKNNVTEQDLKLLGFILDSGKSLIIAINKWDGLSQQVRDRVKQEMDRRLRFVDFAIIKTISALHGTGVGELFSEVEKVYQSAIKKIPTTRLNEVLKKALIAHQPPMMHGHRIKLRYAHAGGQNPPLIVIHGNQVNALPEAYQRYLINTFRKAFRIIGTPIRLVFKESENPYKNKSNKMTESQRRTRTRIIAERKRRERK